MKANPLLKLSVKQLFLPWLLWAVSTLIYGHLAYSFTNLVANSPYNSNIFTSAKTVASLVATYYYWLIILQLVNGVLIDRFGVGNVFRLCLLIEGLGCLLLTLSPQHAWYAAGIMCLRFSTSCSLLTTLTFISSWFSSKKMSLLVAITFSLGIFSSAITHSPELNDYLNTDFWQNNIFNFGLFCLLIFTVLCSIGKEYYVGPQSPLHVVKIRFIRNFKHVFFTPRYWMCGIYIGLAFTPILAFAFQWAPPFFTVNYGFNSAESLQAANIMLLGCILGGPILSYFADNTPKRIKMMFWNILVAFVINIIIIYIHIFSKMFIFCLLFLLGFTTSAFILGINMLLEIAPQHCKGLMSGFINFCRLGIGSCVMNCISVLLSEHWNGSVIGNYQVYTILNFQISMVLVPACLLMALIMTMLLSFPDTRRKKNG